MLHPAGCYEGRGYEEESWERCEIPSSTSASVWSATWLSGSSRRRKLAQAGYCLLTAC